VASGNDTRRTASNGLCTRLNRGYFASLLLLASVGVGAQQLDLSRDDWLTKLRPIVSEGLCTGQGSPFARMYKGTPTDCAATVRTLFNSCVTNDSHVRIPARIVGTEQASQYGQFVAECIGAHYQGSAALKAFYDLQDQIQPTTSSALVHYTCTGKESVFASDGAHPVHSDTKFGIELDEAAHTLRVSGSIANDGAGELDKEGHIYTAYLPVDLTRKGAHFTFRVVNLNTNSGQTSLSLRRDRSLQVGDLSTFYGHCASVP
jgi:hypothetical protein